MENPTTWIGLCLETIDFSLAVATENVQHPLPLSMKSRTKCWRVSTPVWRIFFDVLSKWIQLIFIWYLKEFFNFLFQENGFTIKPERQINFPRHFHIVSLTRDFNQKAFLTFFPFSTRFSFSFNKISSAGKKLKFCWKKMIFNLTRFSSRWSCGRYRIPPTLQRRQIVLLNSLWYFQLITKLEEWEKPKFNPAIERKTSMQGTELDFFLGNKLLLKN